MAAARVRAGDDQFEGPATLTVTIEVVLAETEISPAAAGSEDAAGAEGGEGEGGGGRRDYYLLSAPRFRFRFVEGSCAATPAVVDAQGNAAEGWEDITPEVEIPAANGGEDAANDGGQPAAGTAENSENTENTENAENAESAENGEEPPEVDLPPPPPKRFRWTREFPVDAVDDAFLASLHERPHFVCCLANGADADDDASPPDATATTSSRDTKGNLLGFLPVDVSPLLDGDLCVTRRCSATTRGAGAPPAGLAEWQVSVSVVEPLLTLPQRLRLNPMSISLERVVRLPGINIEETRNPRMLRAMQPTRFALLKEHCRPISVLFDVKVKRSQEAAEMWKVQYDEDRAAEAEAAAARGDELPLTPDVTAADAPPFQRVVCTLPVAQEIASELAGPTEEELKALEKAKKKRARAAAAASKKSNKGKKGKKLSDTQQRIDELESSRDRRRRDMPLCHKTVILAGLLDRVEMLRYLEKGAVKFELHDRDVEDWDACETRRGEHERLITGDPDPKIVNTAVAAALANLTPEEQEDEEAVKAARQAAVESCPRTDDATEDVFDVIDKLWAIQAEDMLSAADTNTHGVAVCRLDALASYTGELRKGFRVTAGKESLIPAGMLAADGGKKKQGKKGGAGADDSADAAELEALRKTFGESVGTGGSVKMREIVRPTKRLTAVTDDEEQASWDFTEEQRLVRNPGSYLLTGTEIVVNAAIARNPMSVIERRARRAKVTTGTEAEADPREGDFEATRYGANSMDALTEAGVRAAAASKLDVTDVAHGAGRSVDRMFERAVYCFSYDDEKTLQELQGAMYEVNQRALPEASLRSHQLSAEEKQGAVDGSLDVITGFTIIDDAFRLVVIEGLGAGGMKTLHKRVRRKERNGSRFRVLADPTITFKERWFTAFDLDLKRIRLRDELPRICESPDIYNRAKVPLEVFEALHRLFRMRSSMRLRHLLDNNLFPTAKMLLRLESKYGEAISLEDMDGASGFIDPNATLADDDSEDDDDLTEIDPREKRQDLGESDENAISRKKSRQPHVDPDAVPEVPHKRKADTDCWNDPYEDFLVAEKTRVHPNFIRDNETKAKSIKAEVLAHRASLPPVDANLPPEVKGQIYIYSGQKLQLTEFRREKMRQRLAKRKNITFTYSSEYQSQTLCLVNEDDIVKDAKELSKSKMTTKSGFVYPAPKDPEEYIKHPRQLSEARREDLRAPYEEPGMAAGPEDEPKPWEMPGATDFDTIPDLKPRLFGGYAEDGTQQDDKEFYRSVHMGGDGVEQEMVDAAKRAKQEWLDAVIVDNIHYQPHYGEQVGVEGARPSQLGKLQDILSGGFPEKLGLKIVHKAKLPSGKRIPFKTPPPSMLSSLLFKDPVDFTAGMRPNDPAHFYGTDAAGEKVNFVTTIHKDMMKPVNQKMLHKRKVTQLTEKEKGGPLFSGDYPEGRP